LAFSQLQSLFFTDTILPSSNYFKTFFEKQYNIYQLGHSFDFRTNTDLGDFLISHRYFGNLIERVEGKSGRDDENFKFIYSRNIHRFSSLFVEGNYMLNSDSRAIGINKVQRLNGNLGINFSFPIVGNVISSLGYERNSQVQLNANGIRYRVDWKPQRVSFSEFSIQKSLNFEFLNLTDGRRNKDISVASNLSGIFPEKNTLYLSVNYKSMRRDFVVFPYFTAGFFDTRSEWKFFPSLNISYNILENLFIRFSTDLMSYNVHRYYNRYDPTNQYSAVRRNLMEQTLTLSSELNYKGEIFEPLFGFSYYSRNEENSLTQNFQLPDGIFTQMVQFEAQKNNYQSRFTLYGNLDCKFSKRDTIFFTTSIGIFRYDTPSAINDDDRDELSSITKLGYSHSFNKSLQIKTNLDLLLNHLVFLKSSRSSLNYWNRILRISINPTYNGDFLRINPNFEVLANYTVYDFESKNVGVQSYIFRQFSYRDSIFLNFSKNFYFFANIIYKLMERGTLYWKEFAMTKETSINEFFGKGLFFSRINSIAELGIGMRIYNIVQQSLLGFKTGLQYNFYSLSPETEIRIFLSKDKTIILQGWYELKFWNYKIQSKTSNDSLMINYLL
jgi:hypothetical protein